MTSTLQALIVAAAVFGGAGLYCMMPSVERRRHAGIGLSLAAIVLLWVVWLRCLEQVGVGKGMLFCVLATLTVVGGAMTVTRAGPVSCALWFTAVVVGTAGLFLLENAQFLATAIVVVYAGAIVVMFLFVVMMAQQRGTAIYDRVPREPGLAILAATVLVIVLASASVSAYLGGEAAIDPRPRAATVASAAVLDDSPGAPQVASLGAALFTHHWVSLEVAGTVLLVAMVGAIVICTRRERA